MSHPPAPGQSKWTVLLVLAAGAFLMPVQTGMLTVALPQLATGLTASPALVTWVALSHQVVMTALLVPLGRLSDVYGRKRLYLGGQAMEAVMAALGGFSQDAYQLIATRVLYGVGSSLILANNWALVSEAFPSQERGKALGLSSAATFLGLALGPFLGGVLIGEFGWRSIFFVLVPFHLLVIALAQSRLPEPAPTHRGQSYDFSGALSFIAGLGLLMLALTFGRSLGWASPGIGGFFAASIALFALFTYIESRAGRQPMLELSTLRHNSQFTLGNLANLCHYTSAHQSVTILIAFYVQWVLHLSATVAGMILLAKFLTMALFSPLSGWLSDKIHPRWLCTLGMAFILSGLLLLADLKEGVSPGSVFLRLSLVGVGIGLFASPNINLVMSALPQERLGVASGTLGTVRSLGQTLGIAIAGGMMAGGAEGASFVASIRSAFLLLAMVSLLGVLTSSRRGRRPA